MRYFLYVGENSDNHYLKTNKIYTEKSKYNENDYIIDFIDFSITNGFDCSEFVELKTINSSIGGLIIALKDLCYDFGLNVDVTISSK